MLEQYLDVGKPGDALAKHAVDRGLVEELLRRMPAAAGAKSGFDERHAVAVDPGQRPVGQHVQLEPVGQAD